MWAWNSCPLGRIFTLEKTHLYTDIWLNFRNCLAAIKVQRYQILPPAGREIFFRFPRLRKRRAMFCLVHDIQWSCMHITGPYFLWEDLSAIKLAQRQQVWTSLLDWIIGHITEEARKIADLTSWIRFYKRTQSNHMQYHTLCAAMFGACRRPGRLQKFVKFHKFHANIARNFFLARSESNWPINQQIPAVRRLKRLILSQT